MQSDMRIDFLDGVRGIGALQVVILHYCSMYFPLFARVSDQPAMEWEGAATATPLFFAINGNVAVFVFFLMSGFVLAQSFNNGLLRLQGVWSLAGKRVLRLFVPVAVSALLAWILISVLPPNKDELLAVVHNLWAANLYATGLDATGLARDALLHSMLLGYQGGSLFDQVPTVAPCLLPLVTSVNPPMWTLHSELWGSMLVLWLCWVRQRAPQPLYWSVIVGSLFVTGGSHFTLFTLGFLAYMHREALLRRPSRTRQLVGVVMLVAGMHMAIWDSTALLPALYEQVVRSALLVPAAPIRLQNELSAVLLMAGLFWLPRLQDGLSGRFTRWLGHVSFSLYLVHFPILFSVGLAIFNLLLPYTGYALAVVMTMFTGIGLSLLAATLFERWVDQSAQRVARRLSEPTTARIQLV